MIANFDDWKAVSSRNLDGKYIVLTGDVDFTGKQYYPLGSRRKPFTGHIKGNMHTVSNATTSGYSDVGLFGKNQGTIEGFNFNNITINGTNNNIGIIGNNSGTVKGINGTNVTVTGVGNAARNVGGLVGNNSGTITEVSMQSTVSGYIDVGGVVGYSSYISNYILSNSTVSGNDEIGGVAGRIYGGNATLSNTVQVGGSITASSRSGRVAFYADRKTKHYALSTIPRGTSDSYISQGTDVDPSVINDLTTINSLIDIDTATTGDTNGSGYIFRYNNDNSRIIVSKAN